MLHVYGKTEENPRNAWNSMNFSLAMSKIYAKNKKYTIFVRIAPNL
jgi:hypothetical protein